MFNAKAVAYIAYLHKCVLLAGLLKAFCRLLQRAKVALRIARIASIALAAYYVWLLLSFSTINAIPAPQTAKPAGL